MRFDELPIDPDSPSDRPRGSEPGAGALPPARRGRPDVLVAVALGGAFGTTLRAALGQAFPTAVGGFPATTLGINLAGSFVLGLLVVVLVERFDPAPRLRPFVTTGLLGGFTTFSTFAVESVQLVRHDRVAWAVCYVAASITGGLAAAFAGMVIGRTLTGAGSGSGGAGPEVRGAPQASGSEA